MFKIVQHFELREIRLPTTYKTVEIARGHEESPRRAGEAVSGFGQSS